MIDNFGLGLTHALMLLAAWRLLARPDLEDDAAPQVKRAGWFGLGGKDGANDA